MSFDMEDLVREQRQIWLKKMQKKDPAHARLFCSKCVAYIGGSGKGCTCD